jgi:CheY-like chemotaxis protein
MPIMDGFESTAMIRDIYQSMKIKPTPYIVGIGESDFILNGNKCGMNEMIQKPITSGKIENYLRKLKLTTK